MLPEVGTDCSGELAVILKVTTIHRVKNDNLSTPFKNETRAWVFSDSGGPSCELKSY